MKTSSQSDCSNIDQKTSDFCCIIVAAGGGSRFGSDLPKQFHPFLGETVLAYTLRSVLRSPRCSECILVISPGMGDKAQREVAKLEAADRERLTIVNGGSERVDSVRNGLSMLEGNTSEVVFIHDAARPGLDDRTIDALMDALQHSDGAAPAIPVVDALKLQTQVGISSVDRSNLFRIQTPQAFRKSSLEGLYERDMSGVLDDFELAQAAGLNLTLVTGHEKLAKITYPEDLARLERLLSDTTTFEYRMGSGYDVHAFEEGNRVTLCGVEIPHTRALKGHSDADVAWHAVTDALLGAIAEGDIGDHFPPSDPQWKGAPSSVFLKFAADRVAALGGRIVNIDVTLICEEPKIKPHREAMRASTCELLELEPYQVSVKATTTEGLGFEGRREGIAAHAIVSIALPIRSATATDC